jgi:anti-sigma regulatory factor (Ser/Thr protein kinase)
MEAVSLDAVSGTDRLVVTADLANVSLARRFVRTALIGAPDEIVSDLQLAASELVTNAIEHGHGGEISISVTVERPRFELAVASSDGDAWILPHDRWVLPDAPSRAGRGLGIVGEIADAVAVARRGSQLVITVTRFASSGSLLA